MPQYRNSLMDEMSRLIGDAAGVAQGVRREAETLAKAQIERVLASMNVVAREEFEAVRDMAAMAREENERLAQRIGDLEAKLAARDGGSTAPDEPVSPLGDI